MPNRCPSRATIHHRNCSYRVANFSRFWG